MFFHGSVLTVSVLKNRRQALKGHEAIVEEAVVEEAVVEEAVAEQAVVEEAVVEYVQGPPQRGPYTPSTTTASSTTASSATASSTTASSSTASSTTASCPLFPFWEASGELGKFCVWGSPPSSLGRLEPTLWKLRINHADRSSSPGGFGEAVLEVLVGGATDSQNAGRQSSIELL